MNHMYALPWQGDEMHCNHWVMPSLSGRSAMASSCGLSPPPRVLREYKEFHNWQVLRLTRSSQEWAVRGEFHVAALPFWIANTRKMQIPAGGPLCLTPQRLLPFHWCASLPDHVLLPSANSIQHKNTALKNGVQLLQPLRLRVPVKSISHTSCLQSSLWLLRLNCLRRLASGERYPSHPMNSLYRDPSVNATRGEWALKGLGWSVRGNKGVGQGHWALFFPPYFVSWTGKSSPPCMPASTVACIS